MGIEDGPFEQQPEQAIASFDFTDIASGTGFVNFFLVRDGTNGFMIDNSSISATEATEGHTHTNATALVFDTNAFNLPRLVRGRIFASFALTAEDTATGNESILLTNVEFFHVDSSNNETSISTAVSTSVIRETTATEFNSGSVVVLTEEINQHFKKGDKLRLKCTTDDGADSNVGYFFHNPSGSTIEIPNGNVGNTQSTILVPFRIDL